MPFPRFITAGKVLAPSHHLFSSVISSKRHCLESFANEIWKNALADAEWSREDDKAVRGCWKLSWTLGGPKASGATVQRTPWQFWPEQQQLHKPGHTLLSWNAPTWCIFSEALIRKHGQPGLFQRRCQQQPCFLWAVCSVDKGLPPVTPFPLPSPPLSRLEKSHSLVVCLFIFPLSLTDPGLLSTNDYCYRPNCSPSNSYAEVLTHMRLYLETGPSRRWLGLKEVIRVGSWSNRTYVLIRRDRDSRDLPFSTHTEKRPCEDTPREWPPGQEERNLPAPWAWTSNLRNCEKIHFCCLSHPACGFLLWRPK